MVTVITGDNLNDTMLQCRFLDLAEHEYLITPEHVMGRGRMTIFVDGKEVTHKVTGVVLTSLKD
jgi:hypothetical protein